MSRPAIDFDTLADIALVMRRDLLAPRGPVPFSAMTLHRRIKSGDFPAPVKLSENSSAFVWGEVRKWLEAQSRGRA